MKFVFILVGIFCVHIAFAKETHKQHGAHVHGAGTLGIAFDGQVGALDFKIPSDSIFGFEYTPKTDKDKKAMQDGLSLLESKISEMVVFDANLKCGITKDKIAVVKEDHHQEKSEKQSGLRSEKHIEHHSEHSETVATFSVKCSTSPVGSKIVFNFQKFFPRIQDLDVQIVVGTLQKSLEAQKNGTIVELK